MVQRVYVESAPSFELRGGNVMVSISSGDERYLLSITRADFRKAVETGKRMLDAADRAEGDRVVHFRTG